MLSPRENMIRAFRHEETEYLPFSLTDFTGAFLPIGDTPRPTSDGRYVDGWGVRWLRQEIGNMPNEAVPPVVEDICDWRDYLRFPDLDALDWEKMFELSMDPEKARRYREESVPEKEDTCSMCGNFCAVKNVNRILEGEIVSIFDE